uniref:Uncharacterized protein n=1 Tax=Oryza sativa subsp. japonica TaxID=39947 RepID=Q8H362_ORYSJ|nr:hypothetical protein [Oryza sativa Japonica Group]
MTRRGGQRPGRIPADPQGKVVAAVHGDGAKFTVAARGAGVEFTGTTCGARYLKAEEGDEERMLRGLF